MKKVLSVFLSLVMIMSVTTGMTMTAKATTKSADQAISWVKSKVNQSIDWDGAYGAQCVDLIMAYYNYLGTSSPGGNGCDYSSNSLPSGWTRTKGGTPKKGDILVYSASSSNPYGHVGIYESDYSHYHQNVSGQYVQCITGWKYNGFNDPYWGCIHPNFNGDDTLVGPSNVKIRSSGKKLIITWDAVKGANCYDVILTDPSGTTNWYHSSVTEKTIPIDKLGTYKVDVQSLYRPNGSSQGQTVGGHSAVISATISIFGAENLKITTLDGYFYLKWDAVSGANCYDAIATDPAGNSNWYHTDKPGIAIKINERPGKWTFRVQSLYRPNGSSQGQTVGGYSDYVNYDLQMTAPKNINVNNDGGTFNVSWDIVSGANCYDVVVTKPNGETTWLHTETNSASTNKFEYGHYEFWIQGIYRTNSLNLAGAHSETISFDYKPNPDFCEHIWDKGTTTKEATCTSLGEVKYTCSICGTTKTETTEMIDHTVVTDEAVPATCTSTGKTAGNHCSVCGEVITAQQTIPALGHDFSNNSEYCNRSCGTKNPNYNPPVTEHNYIGTITRSATCTTSGVITYTCSDCGDSYTEQINALGHNYVTTVTAPNCKDAGYTNYTCSRCGDSYKSDYTSVTNNHNYSSVITKQPTCSSTGRKSYTCSICGYSYIETIAKADHLPSAAVVENFKAPTCTSKGSYNSVVYCSNCGMELSREATILNKSSHKIVIDKAVSPTFEKAGKTEGKHCSACGKVIVAQKKVDKLVPEKTTLSSVSAKSKGFSVKWKKQTKNTTGYQIQYSTSGSFSSGNKTVTVSKNSTTSKVISSLKAKKKYYVRIRTYKSAKGKKYYSTWSSKKSVTTKK